ncbi:MAG: hypothetical protein M1120_00570 [Patescibacteria group bacterium]|nr:hypothetical protein [Patescibacteria group bacterium]
MTIKELESRIKKIGERNQKVEKDKAWETSYARRILIALFTYFAVGIYMWSINIVQPWFNAIIPTTGFLLSTLTFPFFKRLWLKWKNF